VYRNENEKQPKRVERKKKRETREKKIMASYHGDTKKKEEGDQDIEAERKIRALSLTTISLFPSSF